MDQINRTDLSPFTTFSVEEWAKLRADTPMTLTQEEIDALRSVGDPVSMEEVERVYLPISRLLSYYVAATQTLFDATRRFLGTRDGKTPYIIGIGGSVAVGKSTTARILRELLRRWESRPNVDLVTTDGFLLPNDVLGAEGLMERKGFPESYDIGALIAFLTKIKAGEPHVAAPVYSHLSYDIVPGETIAVDRPDILILEGLNVLQPNKMPKDGKEVPFVSDFFDFSIYLDAEEDAVRDWYVDRFMRLKETRFRDPRSYFHRFAELGHEEAERMATSLWERINLINLRENILPTRQRADLILHKDADHSVGEVALRKL